jgi:hypothetical protein
MFGSAILDTAIGLIFVFLLVSLIVSAATELVSGWLNWRAENLWAGIQNLLDSPGAKDWVTKLYEHPLVEGLSRSRTKGFALAKLLAPVPKGPSYIPSRTFALALLDLIQQGDVSVSRIRRSLLELLDRTPSSTASVGYLERETASLIGTITDSSPAATRLKADLQSLVGNVQHFDVPVDELRKAVQTLITNIPDLASTRANLRGDLESLLTKSASPGYSSDNLKDDIQQLISKVPYSAATAQLVKKDLQDLINRIPDRTHRTTLAKNAVQAFTDKISSNYFRDILDQFPNEELRKTVTILLEESGHNVEELKKNLEIWFNNSMDRISGWYKRKTQIANLLLGALVTFALNLDAILIVNALSHNTALRESLVAQAQKFAEQPPLEINTAPLIQQPALAQSGVPGGGQQSGASSLVLTPDTVVGGDSVKGTVNLGSSAPPGGTIVSISNTNPKVAVVIPDTVTILPGETRADFQVTTKPTANSTRIAFSARGEKDAAVLTVSANPNEKYRLLQAQLDQLNLPVGWTFAKPIAIPSQDDKSGDAEGLENQDFREWPGWRWNNGGVERWRNNWWNTLRYHFVGWAVTAIAVSFGAPFWFDLLNKFVAIRSAGKAPEEEPKPPKELPKPLEPGNRPTET